MPAYLPVSTVLSMWGDVLVSGASSSPALSCLSEALWLVLAHLFESAAELLLQFQETIFHHHHFFFHMAVEEDVPSFPPPSN